MTEEGTTPSPDPNLSDLGRAVLGGDANPASGSKPSGPWLPPTPEELQALLPNYQILTMLGRGGMGAVYMGRQIALDRPVAIKILSGALEDSDLGFKERFKNEARAMAKLSHPGIVAIYEFGETPGGLLYIVMEYIDGTDVARMIAAEGRLHTEYAMAITAHVCDALAYAHDRGIIHRDIKPANIMVGYDGVVKVADFGLAKVHTSEGQSLGLTMSGMAMGTMHYIAPEALDVGVTIDQRADLYAVGVMLYQMLTGKVPRGLFELPSLQVAGLDPRYDGIIAKAMREDRDSRYQSAGELRHDLDAILTQPVEKVEPQGKQAPAALPTMARPKRPGGKAGQAALPGRSTVKSAPKSGAGLVWVVFALLGIAGASWWWKRSQEPQASAPSASANATPEAKSPTTPESTAKPTANATSPAPPQPAAVSIETTSNPAEATKERPFVNSLGMKFVPVPGTGVLMCVHETRRQDYKPFASESVDLDDQWEAPRTPEGIRMEDGGDHPVVFTSWDDATRFCQWLSKRENLTYRLPMDSEWSAATGLPEVGSSEQIPEERMTNGTSEFSWGGEWPPPGDIGNFPDEATARIFPSPPWIVIPGYSDGFATTAPVMSFSANQLGIFDLDGNVSEWCQDWFNAQQKERVRRGSAWVTTSPVEFKLSHRNHNVPGFRRFGTGFRCVVELDATPATTISSRSGPPHHPTPSTSSPKTPQEDSTMPNTERNLSRSIDLLALVDPARDTFNGNWKQTPEGLYLEGDGNMGIPFTPGEEYDFSVEFSISSDSIGVVAQQLRFGGKPITWIMSGQAPGFRPLFGFGPIVGAEGQGEVEGRTFGTVRFSKGTRYRSEVRVRKDSLTGLLNGQELIQWKADPARIAPMRIPTLKNNISLAFNAKDGNITFHKATLTPYAPSQGTENGSVSPPPSSPTTWTNTTGRTITAIFKGIEGDNVILDVAGRETSVRLDSLSAESQKLAQEFGKRFTTTETNDPSKATKERPFVNSLGMKFVPVPGTEVLMCIHETRVSDFAAFAMETSFADTGWEQDRAGVERLIAQKEHPVSLITWQNAKDFCAWISQKESATYRLPTDREWSVAAGIGNHEDPNASPAQLSSAPSQDYPWGGSWPPPSGFANYADGSATYRQPDENIAGYHDGFPYTAPVMSFSPNELGIYDLSGNVCEVCEGWMDASQNRRIWRGGSYGEVAPYKVLTSFRLPNVPDYRSHHSGFRIVLELPDPQSQSAPLSMAPAAPAAAPVAWTPLAPGDYADSRNLSIRGRFTSGEHGGLTLRGSEAVDKPQSRYWAALQSNGREVVLFREWRNPGPGDPRFANSTLARTSLKETIPKGRKYTLTFSAAGDALTVLVDDVPVIEVVDSLLPGRFAGTMGEPERGSVEWTPLPAP